MSGGADIPRHGILALSSRLVALALVLPFVSACMPSADTASGSVQAIQTTNLPVPDAASGRRETTRADYHIAPGDRLEISVFQVPDLNRLVEVDGTGHISLPLVGTMAIDRMTTHELEASIAAKLGAKYLQSPQVSVLVKEASGQHVTVDGAVHKPGVFPISGQVSLSEAIAMAGGFDELADPHGILVFRTANRKRMVAKFDMAAIRDGTQSDPTVYAGDTIVADQSSGRSAWKAVRETLPAFAFFAPFL